MTEHGPHSQPFLDHFSDLATDLGACCKQVDGRLARCIEDVLDSAVASCSPGYILRLDDDERPTEQMLSWLRGREYETQDHWSFPRLNLFPGDTEHVTSHNLWPDHQTRLSVKAKSGGRLEIHGASPFGPGEIAPVAIEHHKFLVRSLAERRALVRRYDEVKPGAGRLFLAFSAPEDVPDLTVASVPLATRQPAGDESLQRRHNGLVAERDATVAEASLRLAPEQRAREAEELAPVVLESRSWAITSPLRSAAARLRGKP